MDDYDNIRNALSHIDPHDRDTWFRMGAAIKDELGENGFEMWDEWSRQSDNYKSNDAQSVWKSIKTGHIRIGTLFKTARENGYRPERPYTPPSPETLAQRAEQAKARQLAEQQRIEQAHAKAQKTAYGIWHNARPADSSHAYAQSKGLSAAALGGLRQNEYQGKKQLIIPLYADKKLVNVQTIDEQGNKSFLSGGQKKGAYALIGDFNQRQDGIILAEGYATGASVHQATGKPVIIAFDAGNLKSVSEKLIHTLERDIPVYFAADNDPNQTGLHKAQAAAEAWGERAKIILPQFEAEHISTYRQQHGADKLPTDFNDLHLLAGIEAVKQQLGAVAQEQTMTTQKFELGQAIKHENPRLSEFGQKPVHPQAPPPNEPQQSELSMEEKLKNNYWRVANGYDPLPEFDFRQPETNEPKELRTEWGDFPPVVSNGKLGELKNEPEYQGAKSGDRPQSAQLVEKLLRNETLHEIKQIIGDHQPVIGSTVMTAHDNKVDISIKPNMLQSLKQKEGLNEYWRKEFGYGVEKLTQQEAGHLRKPTLAQIQERVQAAKHELDLSKNKETQNETATIQFPPTRNSETSALSDRTGIGGLETVRPRIGGIFQDVLQQGQTEPVQILNDGSVEHKEPHLRQLESELPPVSNNLRDDEPPPYYPPPDYWEHLSATPPTSDKQAETAPAVSEHDAAVSFTEKESSMNKHQAQMPNSIEYAGREIKPPEYQPDTAPRRTETAAAQKQTAERPPIVETETAAPTVEKSKPVTGLEYEVPAYLKDRYIMADTQKLRIGEYQFGAHSLKYLSQDNAKTVLFEDKGKTLHTARNDQQTVQDMLAVAQAKGWDSIKISGSQEFKQQMWLEAESRGIATKGYKPSPEDLAVLEQRRSEHSTNSIAEAERLKQMSAAPEHAGSTVQTIPAEAVKAADTVKAHVHRAAETPPSQTAKNEYERKLSALPDEQQKKARFFERMGLEVLHRMQPESEAREKATQALYENQADKIRDGKFHAPDPVRAQEPKQEHWQEHSQDRDWEMER